MKIKYLLIGLIILLSSTNLYSQTALAKLKFEDAEAAYNSGNYETAITKLEEAEKLFGKINPPILHLKILCRDKLFPGNKRKGLIDSLKKEASTFLSSYADVEGLEEKYRDVYKINEKYASIPVDDISFNEYLKKEKEKETLAQEAANAANPATIYILRKTGYAAAAVGFPIFIDGENYCKLNTGKFMMIKLKNGKHAFSIQPRGKELKEKTKELEINILPGKVYYLHVRYNTWNGKTELELFDENEGIELLKKLTPDTCH